jgi:hypothetical protein
MCQCIIVRYNSICVGDRLRFTHTNTAAIIYCRTENEPVAPVKFVIIIIECSRDVNRTA